MMVSPTTVADRIFGASSLAIRVQFAAQLLVGVWLAQAYVPSSAGAYRSVQAMHSGGIDRFLQAFHYWGSALLILHGLVHLFASVWWGDFRRDGPRFLEAALEFLLVLAFQITGNLLPFDRHGVQTAGIEAGITARAPLVGPTLSRAWLGGDVFGPRTLAIWNDLHEFVLPALLAVVVAAAWRSRRRGATPSSSAMWSMWGLALSPLLMVGVVAMALPSPLGSPASAGDYTAYNDAVSWYVWPLHGTMRMFDAAFSGAGWIGAFLLPGALVAAILLLPLLRDRISVKVVRIGSGAFLVVFGVGAVAYGGRPDPLTGTRNPPALATEATSRAPIDPAMAKRGRTDFNTVGCSGCHGTDGAVPAGGPSLTTIWRNHADAAYFERYIRNPAAVKSSATMPAFPNLSAGQLAELAEYLREPK